MKVALGADHAGYELKDNLKRYLDLRGYEVVDIGTNGADSVDYPDYAEQVAVLVAEGKAQRGILVCATGMGMSIAANKVAGIRAVACSDTFTARMSREHNNANVLALGARAVTLEEAQEIVRTWLTTEFSGEKRHQLRLDKINHLEKGKR